MKVLATGDSRPFGAVRTALTVALSIWSTRDIQRPALAFETASCARSTSNCPLGEKGFARPFAAKSLALRVLRFFSVSPAPRALPWSYVAAR